jgi:hypothetical protein
MAVKSPKTKKNHVKSYDFTWFLLGGRGWIRTRFLVLSLKNAARKSGNDANFPAWNFPIYPPVLRFERKKWV